MRQPKHSPDLLLVERMTMFEYGAQIVEGKSHRILVRVDTFGEVARFPQSSLQEDQMSSQFVPFLFPYRLSPLRHCSRLLRWMHTAPVRRDWVSPINPWRRELQAAGRRIADRKPSRTVGMTAKSRSPNTNPRHSWRVLRLGRLRPTQV